MANIKNRYKVLVFNSKDDTLRLIWFKDGELKQAVLKATEFIKCRELTVVVRDIKFNKNILEMRKGESL